MVTFRFSKFPSKPKSPTNNELEKLIGVVHLSAHERARAITSGISTSLHRATPRQSAAASTAQTRSRCQPAGCRCMEGGEPRQAPRPTTATDCTTRWSRPAAARKGLPAAASGWTLRVLPARATAAPRSRSQHRRISRMAVRHVQSRNRRARRHSRRAGRSQCAGLFDWIVCALELGHERAPKLKHVLRAFVE
jgi:hypothetical protein